MTPVFRDAAIAHATGRRYGEIVLARPASHAALALLFAAVAGVIVSFIVCFGVTRKAHVAGVLLPRQGLLRVQAPQGGVITELRMGEGQSVRAGDILLVLTSERSSRTHGDTEQTISKLLQARRESLDRDRGQQGLQAQQRVFALQRRADDLVAESASIDAQVVLQLRRVALASESVKRQTELHSANFVSPASVQDRQADLIDQQQRLADLQRAMTANRRDFAAVQAEIRDKQVQAKRDQESATRALVATEQELAENEARRQIVVRASQDGIVTAIAVAAGAAITAGQTLATVLPAGSELEAEVYVPSRAAGFIKPGMRVLLRYQAFPYQKFGMFPGEVREVSASAVQAADMALPAVAQKGPVAEPVYRARVRLDAQTVRAHGHDQVLKSGMALDASVLLEHRRLYEWVLEPLYSVGGRV